MSAISSSSSSSSSAPVVQMSKLTQLPCVLQVYLTQYLDVRSQAQCIRSTSAFRVLRTQFFQGRGDSMSARLRSVAGDISRLPEHERIALKLIGPTIRTLDLDDAFPRLVEHVL